jgi:GTP-binding protein EngB required for normal cell division
MNKFERCPILWDLAIQKVEEKRNTKEESGEEKNVIFIGQQNSGKSSIILKYTDRYV